ncbi:MAG: hypothetical protein Q9197_005855 [Variospora fuerteventurae]
MMLLSGCIEVRRPLARYHSTRIFGSYQSMSRHLMSIFVQGTYDALSHSRKPAHRALMAKPDAAYATKVSLENSIDAPEPLRNNVIILLLSLLPIYLLRSQPARRLGLPRRWTERGSARGRAAAIADPGFETDHSEDGGQTR